MAATRQENDDLPALTLAAALGLIHFFIREPALGKAMAVLNGMLDIGVECGPGIYTPQTVVFGSATNTIYGCYGALSFGIGSDFTRSNNAGNVFSFQGLVLGDHSLPGLWATYGSGFPSGWTGHVSVRFLPTGNEVMISWAFDIAAGTAVATSAITTLASEFQYTDNKIIPGNIAGGGLTGNQYAPAVVSPAGVFQYEGPSFTASEGTAWWYGQGIYTLSLG